MYLNFNVYNNILYNSLRPWMDVNQNELKYKQVLSQNVRKNRDNPQEFFKSLINAFETSKIASEKENIEEFKYLSDAEYEPKKAMPITLIKFPAFINKTTEFFYYLVKNTTISIINALLNEVSHCKNDYDIKYTIYRFLKKSKNQLENTATITQNDVSSLLVLNYLKLSLYNIHFEIQKAFIDYMDEEIISEQEAIHIVAPEFEKNKDNQETISYYINEYRLTKSQTKKETQKEPDPNTTETREDVFVPKQSDFRSSQKGPVRYSDVRNIELFTKFEQELFESKFIDKEYNFIDSYGNKKKLAALYHILIQKNYFRKSNQGHIKPFEKAHYRQFLDNRYNVETNQEFRKCTSEYIEKLKYSNLWIENIEYCR